MKPLLEIDALTLDLDTLRKRCEELAKYVRAANAIADLLAQSPSKELKGSVAKVQEAVWQTFDKSLQQLSKREVEQLQKLYVGMTAQRIT